MSTTTRRKYRFPSREAAEREVLQAEFSATRNYWVAICLEAGVKPRTFRKGAYTVKVWTHHPRSGREFSMGPVAMVCESADCSPLIVDAHEWAHENANRSITPSDQDGYDLRDVAAEVLAAVR